MTKTERVMCSAPSGSVFVDAVKRACVPRHLRAIIRSTGAHLIDWRDQSGRTALWHAAASRSAPFQLPALNVLLAHGATVDAADSDESTPLHAACRGDRKVHVRMAEALLRAGADLERRNSRGQTPLLAACGTESKRMLEALLRAGARVDVADNAGRGPLVLAARRWQMLVMLIEAGARVEPSAGAHGPGRSALAALFSEGWPGRRRERSVEVLLQAGEDPNAALEFSRADKLFWIELRHRPSLVALLLRYGIDAQRLSDWCQKNSLGFLDPRPPSLLEWLDGKSDAQAERAATVEASLRSMPVELAELAGDFVFLVRRDPRRA